MAEEEDVAFRAERVILTMEGRHAGGAGGKTIGRDGLGKRLRAKELAQPSQDWNISQKRESKRVT